MASGRLGVSNPPQNTNTTVYTVPTAMVSTFNVSIVNRGAENALVRVAISTTDSPALTEWVEYDATVQAFGVLERTGLVASPSEQIVVFTDTETISVRVYGFEEVA